MTTDTEKERREAFRALLMYPSYASQIDVNVDMASAKFKELCEVITQDATPIDDGMAEMVARFAWGALWPGCTYSDAAKVFKNEIEMWAKVCKTAKGEI